MYNFNLINSKTEDEYKEFFASRSSNLALLSSYINRFSSSKTPDFTDLLSAVELVCYIKTNDIKTEFDSMINDFLNDLYCEFILKPKRFVDLKIFREPFLSKCFVPENKKKIETLLDSMALDYSLAVRTYINKRTAPSDKLNNMYIYASRFAKNEKDFLLDDILYNYPEFSPAKKEFLINSLTERVCANLGLDFDSITINISGAGSVSHSNKLNMITVGEEGLDLLDNNLYEFMPHLIREIKSLAVAKTMPSSIDDFYAVKNEIFKHYMQDSFLEVYEDKFGSLEDNTSGIYGYMETNEMLRNVDVPAKSVITSNILQNDRRARELENSINKESFFVDLNVLSRLIHSKDKILSEYPSLYVLFDENGRFIDERTILNTESYAEELIRLFYRTYKKYQDKELTGFEKSVATANGDVFNRFNNTGLIDKRLAEIRSEGYTKRYNAWGGGPKNE